MVLKARIHIIKRSNNWIIIKEGAGRAYRRYPSKNEAVTAARAFKLSGYPVVIHKTDGTVERWL